VFKSKRDYFDKIRRNFFERSCENKFCKKNIFDEGQRSFAADVAKAEGKFDLVFLKKKP
jgi:hypothetical protein